MRMAGYIVAISGKGLCAAVVIMSELDLSSYLRGDLGLLFFGGRLYALLRNEGLQNSSVRVLRVAKVKDLCNKVLCLVECKCWLLHFVIKFRKIKCLYDFSLL